MRVPGRHDDGFPLVKQIFRSVNGDFSNAVQTGDEGVTVRFMGADLLALCKGEQGDAHRRVLRQSLADNLSILIRDLFLQR